MGTNSKGTLVTLRSSFDQIIHRKYALSLLLFILLQAKKVMKFQDKPSQVSKP